MKQQIFSTDILIVEDDPHDLELTLRTISKYSSAIRTVTVRGGVEALEYLFGRGNESSETVQNVPRLIVLDLKLPRVNGLEVIKKIKSHQTARTIPVVVFSSSTQDDDILTAYRNGANSFLSKPVQYEEYTHAVTSLLQYWITKNRSVYL